MMKEVGVTAAEVPTMSHDAFECSEVERCSLVRRKLMRFGLAGGGVSTRGSIGFSRTSKN